MRVVRVLLVDDQDLFLRKLAESVRLEMATDTRIRLDLVLATSYGEARAVRGFDAAVIDEHLVDQSGLDLIAAFRSGRRHRRTRFVLMSADLIDPLTHRAQELGAAPLAKLPTPALVAGIAKMVRTVADDTRTSEEERVRVARSLSDEVKLSPALRAVLEGVARDQTYAEIAQARGSSESTVKTQAKAILAVLRAHNIPIRESLRATLDYQVIEARYDD